MMRENSVLYVDTPDALVALSERLDDSPWLALDTEFQREKTYYPKLCLLQVATPEVIACVDTLALDDLGPLLGVIYEPRLTKVMHAASQDLEIFYHLRGVPPAPVFDTQLAAPLLGHPDQIGYGALVERVLGARLDKAQTRTDWTRRPLSPAQLRYAADDVRYLAELYPRLRDALEARGRMGWLQEDFAALSDPARYENCPEQAWRRVRAAERLKGPRLSVLQALAAWREQTAQSEDRPRGWLVRDDVLADMARLMPESADEMSQLRGLHERFVKRHGERLLAIIRDARQRPPHAGPTERRPPRTDAEQDALVDALMAVAGLRGAQESLNPDVLVTRKELARLVLGERELGVLRGWRRNMVGDALLGMLGGELALCVDRGRLQLVRDLHPSP